jgi:hypothetical protein
MKPEIIEINPRMVVVSILSAAWGYHRASPDHAPFQFILI